MRGQTVRREVRHVGARLHPVRDGHAAANLPGYEPACGRQQDHDRPSIEDTWRLHSCVSTRRQGAPFERAAVSC